MYSYIRYSLKRDLFAASLSGPIGDFGCDYPAVAERENPGGGKTSGAWFLRGNASMGRVNARFINQPLGPDVVRGCGTRMLLPHVGVDVGFSGVPRCTIAVYLMGLSAKAQRSSHSAYPMTSHVWTSSRCLTSDLLYTHQAGGSSSEFSL
jgi:hypothetical protein